MDIATSEDQKDFVSSLVFTAGQWLEPVPADCQDLDPLPERLGGLVFSLFPELEGAGNMPQMRLSPKGQPDLDLVEYGLHDQWPNIDADQPQVTELLTAVADVLRRAQSTAGEPREAMGGLVADLCRLIEAGYELRPQFFDADTDRYLGDGDDVAPGVTAAFLAAWSRQD